MLPLTQKTDLTLICRACNGQAKYPVDCKFCLGRGEITIEYRAAQSEEQLQAQIVEFHSAAYPEQRGLLFHVNNKARNRIEGNKFKAMGVHTGVSDLIWLRPGGRPILLEVKFEGGQQTKEQREWQRQVEQAGYEYRIVHQLSYAAAIFRTLTPTK